MPQRDLLDARMTRLKSRKWNEPLLAECELRVGAAGRRVIARLGFPRPTDGLPPWRCPFQITGLKGSEIKLAPGVDGFQAVSIAVDAIRRQLDRLKHVTSVGTPYEIVFPPHVRTDYGLAFHRHLCGMLNRAIKKKEDDLTKERLAWERRRKLRSKKK